MKPKEEAIQLFEKFMNHAKIDLFDAKKDLKYHSKQCTLICVDDKYNALRELLFNLRSCRVIESDKVYLYRIDALIKEEKEEKDEINKL